MYSVRFGSSSPARADRNVSVKYVSPAAGVHPPLPAPGPSRGSVQPTRVAVHVKAEGDGSRRSVYVSSGCHVYRVEVWPIPIPDLIRRSLMEGVFANANPGRVFMQLEFRYQLKAPSQ